MRKLSFRSQNQRKKSLKYGGYSTITIMVLLAALILVNVIFGAMDITVDLTSEKLYTPGEQTLDILAKLEDDITIYGLYNTGTETNELNDRVVKLVKEYTDLSKHVSFEIVDPLNNPAWVNQFLMDDSSSLPNGSLVIVNNNTGKFKTLTLENMYEVTTDYTYLTRTVSGFSAEEALTTSIQYVSMTRTPVLYQLQGHSEALLSTGFLDYLSYSNYTAQELNLVLDKVEELVPDAATVVLVNNPRQDLNDTEYAILLDYMEHGGRLMFMAAYDTPELPNFDRLLARFGLSITSGTMIEVDANNYYQYPSLIIPRLAKNNELTSYLLNDSNNYVLMVLPAAVEISDEVSNRIKINSLVTTSETSVIKDPANGLAIREEGDIDGPFNLVVTAEEEVYNKNGAVVTSKMVVIGNTEFINTYATTGNYKLTTILCDYLQDTGDKLYITAKDLEEKTITTSAGIFFLGGAIFVIVIPVIIIAIGLVIFMRRKHR